MRTKWLLAALVGAGSLFFSSVASAQVKWMEGRVDDPTDSADPESSAAPLEAYEDVITDEKRTTTYNRELAGFYGVLGTGTYGVLGGVAVKDGYTGGGVAFLGAAGSALGALIGAIAAPTRSDLEEDLGHARELLPDRELAAAEVERAFARAAARERVVRKVTGSVEVAGGAVTIAAGAAVALGDEKYRREMGTTFLAIGALHAALGITDLMKPWEIETRYEKARSRVFDLNVAAAPVPGGAMVQVGGTF
jgi:hypothetical protein